MYAYITGEVCGFENGDLILDHDGIGYRIAVSERTAAMLHAEERYRVYVLQVVRDDGIFLFGFIDPTEREMFQLLIKVSAVGPKTALGILSALGVDDLRRAVLNSDIAALTRAPGVGKKTAGRILLDLIDPIRSMGFIAPADGESAAPKSSEIDLNVAIEALVNLGYAKNEAERAVKKCFEPGMRLEQLIRLALSEFS